MTDRSEQHCGHECGGEVCFKYRSNFYQDKEEPCICKKCMDDTRTHSAAPGQHVIRGFVMFDRRRDFAIWLREHDERTKHDERERMLKEIQEKQLKKWTLATKEINAFFESLRGEQR